ncbi:uncharacterized protein LOC120346760 [Styela clava]
MRILLLLGLALTVAGKDCFEPMTVLPHGEVTCTSYDGAVGSSCELRCTDPKYEMVRPMNSIVTCLPTGEWDKKFSCCQKCDKAADIVIVVDSSGSITRSDYGKMKNFIANVIGSFEDDKVQFSAVRFATNVDTRNKILFGEYGISDMVEKVELLPGPGGKTALGAALSYTRTAMLRHHNREKVPDMVWVITDGDATDSVKKAARLLRRQKVEIIALGIKQPGEPLSIKQLEEITGNPDNVIEVKGMESLKEELRGRIVGKICKFSCPHYPPTTPPPPPKCDPNPPSPPTGGSVNCDSDTADIGTKCDFVCKPDSQLEGPEDAVCEEDGKGGARWSQEAKKCVKKCKKPPPPTYGTVKCSNLDNKLIVGSSCTFKCNEGYQVVGKRETECEKDGTWSEKAPKCEPLCKPHPPPGPINGEVECNNEKAIVGTRCDFACKVGYSLQGSEKTICKKISNEKAEWSHKAPICTKKCKKPDPPTYGTIKCDDKLIVGSKCEFKCEEGYEMVGKPKTICEKAGTWSEKEPKCIPKCTPHPPPKPEDGFVDCDNVVATAGTICQYKCKSGHKLIGSENTVCEETARGVVEWSHKAPTCKKTCEKPETIDHGTVKCDKPDKSLIEGAVCDFECDDGFNMKGQKNAICKADGTWSAKPPTCEEPKECEKWNEFENGKMTCKPKTKFVEGTRCDFKCDDDYVMIPGWKNYTMCNASVVSTEVGLKTELHWTNQLPCCGKVTCDKDAKMDLVIVMDSSGSINPLGKNGPDYYSKMKDFLVDLIDGFKGDGFHFGVVRFNTEVVKEDTILLDKYIGNKAGIKKAILGFDGPGGKTATAAAIKYVRKKVLPTGRKGVSDAILVVTDGAATDVKDLPAEIKAIRDGGVDTFALAIGPKVGETVDIIAGTEDNKIIISDMEGLTKELIDKVLSKFCSNTCEGK